MLALIEMSMIFVGTYLQKSSSQNLQEAYRNQLKYRDLATECRSFAVTGDIDYFRNYWNEAKNEMHREKTIEEIEESNLPDSEQHYLERAKYFSDTLMHIEISSMRLTLESQEITADQYADQYAEGYHAQNAGGDFENRTDGPCGRAGFRSADGRHAALYRRAGAGEIRQLCH